jgi:hypothetical protein
MNLAAAILLALVFGLLLFDCATLHHHARRALWVEAVVFVIGAFFIAFPDAANAAAHAVGIGRGVDFILYPLVIWLVRESLANRRRRLADGEQLTRLVRALAITGAHQVRSMEAGEAATSAGEATRPLSGAP